MTGRQLFNQLQNFGDLDVTEAQVTGWIDMCQKEVSMEVPVVYTQTVTPVVIGTEVTTSSSAIKLISAVDNLGNEYPLKSIQVKENNLVFSTPATSVIVTYSGPSVTYTSLNDELTIHPIFHSHVVYFLISMFYDMDGEGDSEESSLAERFYQRWMFYKTIALSSLQSSDYDTTANAPVSTTDVLPRSRHTWGNSYYE